ncbi:GntR family transcriptional regulator [Salinibacterium sp. G-O1]|uniref:GntR family transcriptional regulator n=1 Tax=Salinibacterium sp. G-O1 TaxID=3046208 RepID=UPI0024BAB0C6|nr:GntR family transcriptional regulator [Salinibacterium sp. G-O1]MDJ0336241.1 GntR family transcriptional regulator [Salinibacterium sp. G-O1]
MMSIDNTVLPGAIYDELRASIITQQDAPGSTLTESAVAERFAVARPTARLAIERLVADGLLRREPHHAARVPLLSRDDIVDLFYNRAIVEAEAAAALASSATVPPAAVAANSALRTDPDFARHDIAFHRAIVASQPSLRLSKMHDLLMGEIELCIGQVQSAHLISANDICGQHEAILDAIGAGDAEGASTLMREHIHGARDRLLTHGEDQQW